MYTRQVTESEKGEQIFMLGDIKSMLAAQSGGCKQDIIEDFYASHVENKRSSLYSQSLTKSSIKKEWQNLTKDKILDDKFISLCKETLRDLENRINMTPLKDAIGTYVGSFFYGCRHWLVDVPSTIIPMETVMARVANHLSNECFDELKRDCYHTKSKYQDIEIWTKEATYVKETRKYRNVFYTEFRIDDEMLFLCDLFKFMCGNRERKNDVDSSISIINHKTFAEHAQVFSFKNQGVMADGLYRLLATIMGETLLYTVFKFGHMGGDGKRAFVIHKSVDWSDDANFNKQLTKTDRGLVTDMILIQQHEGTLTVRRETEIETNTRFPFVMTKKLIVPRIKKLIQKSIAELKKTIVDKKLGSQESKNQDLAEF